MDINKLIIKSITLIILVLVITLGISYAYFQVRFAGLESTSTISIGGADISIEYTGTQTIIAQNVIPGWSGKKYFKLDIKNSRNEQINYDINLVVQNSNFYTTTEAGKSYLTYGLYECSSSSDTSCTTELAPHKLLDVSGSGTRTVKSVTNTKTETKYYALELKFPNQTVAQTKTGTDGNLVTFSGYVTINSSNKYFDGPKPIVDYIASLDKASNGLEIDDTDDHNLRYVGATPNNYLSFNNETWRIIGIFNVYSNDTQKNEKLVKIIRNESLGNYSWDTSDSSINYGLGINEWSQADLMTELNTDYLDTNKTNGKNIKSGYIDKIANVRWNLGGVSFGESAINTYNQERGTTHVSNPSDGITRTNTWNGKIALVYPSDYGYASTDTDCRSNLHFYANSVYSCKNNNWMFNSTNQWTLSPESGYASNVFDVFSDGDVSTGSARSTNGVRPALFLKSDVLITGGTGESIEKAYVIE